MAKTASINTEIDSGIKERARRSLRHGACRCPAP